MKVAVTGGAGLLGRAVVSTLLARGHDIRALDLRPLPPDLPAPGFLSPTDIGRTGDVDLAIVDIRHEQAVNEALAGVDAVIHTASVIDLHLGRPPLLHFVNVVGTANVLDACRRNGIGRLVHMSSAEVVTGPHPHRNLDEDTATYPDRQLTYYGTTKQAAEELVLAANGSDLATCAFRTYGLFGPGDRTVVPSFLSRLPTRTIRFIGDTTARTDVVYAPNLAYALVLAAEQLDPTQPWAGTPFHATDAEPVNIQRFLADLVAPLGYRVDDRFAIPRPVVATVASALAQLYRLTHSERHAHPPVTDHSLRLVLDDHWLDGTRLRTTLGYEPPVARSDAIAATQEWLLAEAAL